jgi:uncharacterized membrane protein
VTLRRSDARRCTNKEGIAVKGSRIASIVVMVVVATMSSGCCGGSKKEVVEKTPVQVETESAGEQLMDLQKAYESGAISEDQYNKMKEDIIKKSGSK